MNSNETHGPPGVIKNEPTVRVLKVEVRPGDRPLKAFIDVEIDGLIIRSLRIVQQPGKWPQVLCPQISIKPPGKPAYFRTVITLPDALKSAVDFAVIGAWKEVLAGQKEQNGGRLDINLPADM